MAPADSEERQVAAEGLAAQRQLEGIPLVERGPELGMPGLAVVPGIHVGAAGQQQPVDAVEDLRASGGRPGAKIRGSPPAASTDRT